MDELIAALKKRADPEGVKEIPIRKIGGNRIEIILPQASNEEVEEVKKMLTDVGSLEFRILANGKHDADVIDRALGPAGWPSRRRGYKWARLGEISTGTNPTFTSDTDHRPPADVEEGPLRRHRGLLDRQGRRRATSRPRSVKVRRNTTNTLILDKPHGLKSIASYRIEYNPSRITAGDPNNPEPERLDHPRGKGRTGPDRDLDPLQPRPARAGSHRQVPEAGPARRGRAAPAGRPVRVRSRGATPVRQADARASPRGRGSVSAINWRSCSTTW